MLSRATRVQAAAAESLQGSDCAGGSLFIDPHPRPPQQRNSFGGGDRGGRGAPLPLPAVFLPATMQPWRVPGGQAPPARVVTGAAHPSHAV